VTIVPRWEWRTFGSGFGPAETAFSALPASAPYDSDELYLIAPGGANVKIRDELMDIKTLEEVNADGLEQWRPVLKTPFPLSAADVARVAEALGVQSPSSAQGAASLDELVNALGGAASGIRIVSVHKRRVRYTVGGCPAEITDLVVDGRPTRTLAIEGEDAAAVAAAVRDVGLGGTPNVSYPRALAQMLEGQSRRYAVIDVGTNSVKLHIAERRPDGSWHPLIDRAEVTRLGENLASTGTISDAALDRTMVAITDMRDEATRQGAVALAALGTAGLRIAGNSAAVIEAIRERTGVAIEVISGDEESRLAYLATVEGLVVGDESLVVFDTGGGSTQFTFGKAGEVVERFSVNVGAARYTERFGLDGVVGPEVIREVRAAISADFSRIHGRQPPKALIGMGGAITNLTAVKLGLTSYDPAAIQGAVLEADEVDRQIELYRRLTADQRRAIEGLQPKRAEVILAGACIVRVVMDEFGKDSVTVSDRGLRHGVLIERFGAVLNGQAPAGAT
jgi:exopolyphosphatase/guanosine-5'-triphosphate,3'-diphosphate pyrophosphatase